MPKQVEARFTMDEKVTTEHKYGGQVDVSFYAVTAEDGDWESFTDATPMGSIEMMIEKGYPAADFFEPGATYRVVFQKTEEGE